MKHTTIFITTILALALLSPLLVEAQSFTLRAGGNLSNLVSKESSTITSDNYKLLVSYNAGLTYENYLSQLIGFETGLLFYGKGFRTESDVLGQQYKSQVNLFYLNVPYNVKLKFDISEDLAVAAHVGAFFDIALFGKLKEELGGIKESRPIEFGFDEYTIVDAGLNFGAGLKFKSLALGVNYAYGLANIVDYDQYDYKAYTRVFSFHVGYSFYLRERI